MIMTQVQLRKNRGVGASKLRSSGSSLMNFYAELLGRFSGRVVTEHKMKYTILLLVAYN
ncbi:hypothetical protein J2Y45_004704 [Dyadobacter sp. BE34]|uniref:Uncharacterized protein n=1 Tax=Dyadobacter fermentans TaxID=94254 RepID=A0ABU1R3K0_9BACT|nr:hypothetical protein [Dyadobacter fermentans]MDR7045245.1 hypothetical protein [Dyadobacter sp. BE242]MDR7199558.1 hypothetical protein [Dyadobacter sp. BE34]MDR7217983.1 hypothetical protein [Dyadobacter sp. BE31]MDR7265449.1 hypothetical protein [Dyadobacter sp. BE32]